MNRSEEDENELNIIREFFDAVDLDCSGFIDETELAAVVDLPPDQIKEVFKKLDTDGDGRISIEEFTENYKHFQTYAEDIDKYRNNNDISTLDQIKNLSPKDPVQDTGYLMSEPEHRKNRPPVRSDIKRKAAKYLGQEYLDDLYEVARSRDDPMLLESLENFLTATVESLLQKQSDNEKLDTALRRATEKNTEIAVQLEEEMEHQVAALEEKIRKEEQAKLEQQKQDAHAQLLKANYELEEMEKKIVDLENKISNQTKKENEMPDQYLDQIRKKDQENQQLQNRLLEFQTQMSLMRTEVAAMKAEYDEQSNRLENERGTVLSCVLEQENLTRQLQLLHEANKKLHDTNDDLRSALDLKRSNSFMSTEPSPVKRSASCMYPRPSATDFQSSFRSDPGFMRNSTMNNDLNDTDDDSRQSFPHDDDEINEQSLLKELMAAENKSPNGSINGAITRPKSTSSNGSFMETSEALGDREHFIQQLEILSETNRRLGQSNDELRNALSLLSGQIRSEQGSDTLSVRESPQGCYSAPVTPYKDNLYEEERPNSTSSPRKVLLTKSGCNSLSESRSMPDLSVSGLGKKKKKAHIPVNNEEILPLTTESMFTAPMTTMDDVTDMCNCGAKIETYGLTTCESCLNADTDAIVEDISMDEQTIPVSASSMSRNLNGEQPQQNDGRLREPHLRPNKEILPKQKVDEESLIVSTASELQSANQEAPLPSRDEDSYTESSLTETFSESEETSMLSCDFNVLPKDELSEISLTESKVTELKSEPSTHDKGGSKVLPKSKISFAEDEELIEPVHVEVVEHSMDDIFSEMRSLPPIQCDLCGIMRKIDREGIEFCPTCTTNDDSINQPINQLPESTLLTESESESDNYSEQETSHFNLVKRAKPIFNDTDQDATYETDTNMTATNFTTTADTSMATTSIRQIKHRRSDTLLRNLESEMSMYARQQSDEESDEDDMDDEELIRLVDQTNDETNSLSEDPITVEEKILEERGLAVGSSASDSQSSINTTNGEPDELFKLVLAGNAAVGKSSFIIRLCKGKFYSALNSTLGVDFQMKTLEVDQKNVALQLWDTAGQERFRSIAKSYFRRVDGVILLYDVTCENSFLDVRDWIDSIECSNNNRIPIILCGNKIDLRPHAIKIGMPVVTREQGQKLAKDVGALFIETSAKEGTNIHKTCKDLIRLMHKGEEEEKPRGMTLEDIPKKKKTGCCRT